MESISVIQENFNLITGIALNYIILLAGVGLLSMALLDVIKELFSAKEKYHFLMTKRWLKKWTDDALTNHINNLPENEKNIVLNNVFEEFNQFFLGNNNQASSGRAFVFPSIGLAQDKAIYALDAEKLTAKLHTALEKKFYMEVGSSHWQCFFTALDKQACGRICESFKEAQATNQSFVIDRQSPEVQRLISALNNKIDTFQIELLYVWGKLNRFLSIILGMVILYFILKENVSIDSPKIYILSILGGVLAPISKNLLASLKGIKKL